MVHKGEDGAVQKAADQFLAMDWPTFEKFALDVIRSEYRHHGLEVSRTGPGPDGGRDGEIGVVVGGERLGVPVGIWIEVKRHRQGVGVKAGGAHLSQALVKGAKQLVFISATHFTPGLEKLCQDFERRTGLHHRLISSDELLELAKTNDVDLTEELRTIQTPLDVPAKSVRSNDRKTDSTPAINVEHAEFLRDPRMRLGDETSSLQIDVGICAFLSVRFRATGIEPLSRLSLEVLGLPSGVMALGMPGGDSIVLSNSEAFSATFAIISDEIVEGIDLGKLKLSAQIGKNDLDDTAIATLQASLGDPTRARQRLSFTTPTLPFVETQSQRQAFETLADAHAEWRQHGGVSSVFMQAAAGVGKSRILERARRAWLGTPAAEIWLDGATDRRVSSIFDGAFRSLFPIDAEAVAGLGEDVLQSWLDGITNNSELARELSFRISRGESLEGLASPSALAALLASLLQQLAPSRMPVIVFEDLHKVGGDVLRFLKLLQTSLRRIRASAFFVFTSRFQPEINGDSNAWNEERLSLASGDTAQACVLEPPSKAEARAILQAGSPLLYEEFAGAMLDRSGVTPFQLTEMVRFLAAKDVIQAAGEPGQWRIHDPSALRSALKDPELVRSSATLARLNFFMSTAPSWLKDWVDSAACIGREFDTDQLYSDDDVPVDRADLDTHLSTLKRENVWEPVVRHGKLRWRFSHDLIHEAVVTRLCEVSHIARRFNLAERLNQRIGASSQTLSLALQFLKGDGDTFVSDAAKYSLKMMEHGFPHEAYKYASLEEAVLEQGSPSSINPYRKLSENPIYRVANLPELSERSQSTRHHYNRLISAKRRRLVASSATTGGAGSDLSALISDLTMLAAKVGDIETRAIALQRQGNYHIQRGENDSARTAFLASIEAFKQVNNAPEEDVFEAVLGHAISLRLLGDRDARSAIEQVEALAKSDPNRLVRFHANYGALFMYSDPLKRRYHWEKAKTIAIEADLPQQSIHLGLDVVSIDLIEGRNEDAAQALPQLLSECEERRLDGFLMRALIMSSALHITLDQPEQALTDLDEARRLGFLNQADRRLWKVHSNSALAFEMIGDKARMIDEDLRVARATPEIGWEKRNILAAANIILRARRSEFHSDYENVIASLNDEAHKSAQIIVSSIDANEPLNGVFPQEHLKSLRGLERFVMV